MTFQTTTKMPVSANEAPTAIEFVVNAGTVSSLRLRGRGRPCYNMIEIEGRHVDVARHYPFHGEERIIQFFADTLEFEKYTRRIEDEVTSRR